MSPPAQSKGPDPAIWGDRMSVEPGYEQVLPPQTSITLNPQIEIVCSECGATVQDVKQYAHRLWHAALNKKLAELEVALYQKSLREIEADLA